MFSVALKLLLRHIDRTAITILMLVPVVALLTSSNLVASGYLQQAAGTLSLVQPSNSYVAYQQGSASPSSGSLGYDSFVRIQASGASSALPMLSFQSGASDGGRSANASVLATNTTAFVKARNSIVYGKVAAGPGQVDAGAIVAKVLHIRVGDNVTVDAFSQTRSLSVVGILNSTDQSDTGLILPLSSAWTAWPQTAEKISYVEFVSSDPNVVSGVSQSMTVIKEKGVGQIASSFGSQTANLLTNWSYVLFALSAAVAVAASLRLVAEVSREFDTVRALGARLSTARALVFYQLLMVSAVSVLIGLSAGIVSTSMLATLLNPIDKLSLTLTIDPWRLLLVGTAAFLLILGAGSLALRWLPQKIGDKGVSE